MAREYHSLHSPSWKVMMPVMIPVAGWLLVTTIVVLLSYLAARRRRDQLIHNLPVLFFWIDPRSRLASLLRRPWNPQTFDRLMLKEFEDRDHPPVIAVIGPLPWFAPTIVTNDAAVITEMVKRAKRRIATPHVIPRSNSSGNLQLFYNTGNPHNRHLPLGPPKTCVEEYHHLVFATATGAVKEVLGKWERRVQAKRAKAAARQAKAITSPAESEAKEDDLESGSGKRRRPRPPSSSSSQQRCRRVVEILPEEDECESDDDDDDDGDEEGEDEEECDGVESNGAIKVNVWRTGRKLSKRMHQHLYTALTKPPAANRSGSFSRSTSGSGSNPAANPQTGTINGPPPPLASPRGLGGASGGFLITRIDSSNDLTDSLEQGNAAGVGSPTSTMTSTTSLPLDKAGGAGRAAESAGPGAAVKAWLRGVGAAVSAPFVAAAEAWRTRAARAKAKREDEERLADIKLLLANDEVLGHGDTGPIVIPSHMAEGLNESTAHALSVVMMVLAHYPKYQDLIYDEACRVLGRGKKTVNFLLLPPLAGVQELQRLPYARGVMNEVFRLYPPDKDVTRKTPGQMTVSLPPTAAIEALERNHRKNHPKPKKERRLPVALTPTGSGNRTTPRALGGGGGYTPRGSYTPSPRNSTANGGGGGGFTPSNGGGNGGRSRSWSTGAIDDDGMMMPGMGGERPRLAPIPSFTACAVEASLPQGTALTLSLFALHRHSALYENPHAFQPERWIARHSSKRHGPDLTMLTFGGDRSPASSAVYGSNLSTSGSNNGSYSNTMGPASLSKMGSSGLGGSGVSVGSSGGSGVSTVAGMLIDYDEDGSVAFPQQMIQLQVLTTLLMLLQRYRIEKTGQKEEDHLWEDEDDIDATIRAKIYRRSERKKVRLVPRVSLGD